MTLQSIEVPAEHSEASIRGTEIPRTYTAVEETTVLARNQILLL